jgi:thioredoxin reductase
MDERDVVVIGGGAAGLSAALVLSRARRRVLVVDSGAPRNAPAANMHGFLSRDGFSPADLLAAGRIEVQGYGGTITGGSVIELALGARSWFTSLTASGSRRGASSWPPACATSYPTSPVLPTGGRGTSCSP